MEMTMFGTWITVRRRSAALLLCLLAFCSSCNRGVTQPGRSGGQAAVKRYPFKGKVVAIDKQAGRANVDNEPIAGFMDSMVMGYTIKPADALAQLQPGDSITAEVVVQGEDYWLENVAVVQHAAHSTS
jgi:Cu/Ag efflux protein CusF